MGKAHSNAYAQIAHFYELPFRIRRTLLCGRDASALGVMAARWEWEETSTDWRVAIDRTDIDVVDIALPNYLHAEVAIAAAGAGKIVFCEKPLALSVADAEAMARAAQGVATMVWFNYRRVPAIAYAHELLRAGRLGTIFHYDAAYRQQWGPDTSRALTWKMDPAQAGSGVADDLLTHLLDTALYLNGPVTEGIALSRTFAERRAVDDAFLALLAFENGSVGTFEATRFGIGCKNANTFRIHGSGGMLRFNLERLNHLEFLDAANPPVEQGARDVLVTDMKHPIFPHFWKPGHIIGYEHTFIAALGEFLDCLERGTDFHPNFADGVAVQRILAALQQSAKDRQWTAVGGSPA
jgi:predicted dehydrogenase